MKVLVAEKLSEHRYKTPEGYLICVDSILARTGKQTYRRNEIFGDSEDTRLVEVDRKAEEVFSPETMASFENKPICVEHPDVDINSNNISEFAVGFVRDIRKGEYEGEPVMVGTLVITDAKTIEEIENGEHTDLSCGYDCEIEDCENPEQKFIRGNHIALCEQGRAGIARIVDSVDDKLVQSSSKEAFNKNVATEIKAGKDPKQAVAIAYSVQRKNDEESTYTEVTKNLEKEADKDMKWLDTVIDSDKDKATYRIEKWGNGKWYWIETRHYDNYEKSVGGFNSRKEAEENFHKLRPLAKLDDCEYVPFSTKDELKKMDTTKEQVLSFISSMLKDKTNIHEDSEGVLYLTTKAYEEIKQLVKNYHVTQNDLEKISKYFFGRGGYNMFR